MINDILDWSQISHGKLRIIPSTFSVLEVLKEVAELIKFQAKRKGLEFITEDLLPKEKICLLYNDPNRLKQIVLNLLGNALKFTEKGMIKITIALAGDKEEKEEEYK